MVKNGGGKPKTKRIVRKWLTSDEAAQATSDWAKELADRVDLAINTGIETLDLFAPKIFAGQVMAIIGAKANGKTPLIMHLTRHNAIKYMNMQPVGGRMPSVALWKGEETIERTLLQLLRDKRANARHIASGDPRARQAFLQAASEQAGLPVQLLGRTSNRFGTMQVTSGDEFNDRLDVGYARDALEGIARDNFLGLFCADYAQCFHDSTYELDSLTQMQRVSEWFMNMPQWLDAPVVVGLQANLMKIMARSRDKRMPMMGDVFYGQSLEHGADIVLGIGHPIKHGLSKVTIKERVLIDYNLDGTKIEKVLPARELKATPDLFLLEVLAWRDTVLPGLVLPLSFGGGATGRPFGDIQEIPFTESQRPEPKQKASGFSAFD